MLYLLISDEAKITKLFSNFKPRVLQFTANGR